MKNKKPGQWETVQSRRGVAIEMAMLFLVVVVALSVLLVSVSMMQIGKKDIVYEEMEQRMVLEQIGTDFCLNPRNYQFPAELTDEYSVFFNETTLRVDRIPEGEGEDLVPVLTVELTKNGNTYTVTKWSYGE